IFASVVWAPAWRTAPGDYLVSAWIRAQFWRGLWLLLGLAVLGEAAVLATKTATTLGTGVAAAAANPNGMYRVFSETRFGEHLQVRIGLLLVLIAVALWDYLGRSLDGAALRRSAAPAA